MNRDRFWTELEAVHAEAERFCRRLEPTLEDGDDLYQESILRAYAGCDSLNDAAAFRPWLYRLIINLFKNRHRGAWWRRFVPLTSELEGQLPGRDPSGQHQARRRLTEAFTAISPEDRALITLHEIEGWTVAELAKMYDKPGGTIKARLSRARSRMRKALLKKRDRSENSETVNMKLEEAPVCVVTKPETE